MVMVMIIIDGYAMTDNGRKWPAEAGALRAARGREAALICRSRAPMAVLGRVLRRGRGLATEMTMIRFDNVDVYNGEGFATREVTWEGATKCSVLKPEDGVRRGSETCKSFTPMLGLISLHHREHCHRVITFFPYPFIPFV